MCGWRDDLHDVAQGELRAYLDAKITERLDAAYAEADKALARQMHLDFWGKEYAPGVIHKERPQMRGLSDLLGVRKVAGYIPVTDEALSLSEWAKAHLSSLFNGRVTWKREPSGWKVIDETHLWSGDGRHSVVTHYNDEGDPVRVVATSTYTNEPGMRAVARLEPKEEL